jgi:hypothetical protein
MNNSMEQSPSWEANCRSAIQDIPRFYRAAGSLLGHHRANKSLPLNHALSLMNPVHICLPYIFNLIFFFHLQLSLPSSLFPSGFSTKIHIFLISHTYTTFRIQFVP